TGSRGSCTNGEAARGPHHGLREVQVRASQDGSPGQEEAARHPPQGSEVPAGNRRARLHDQDTPRARVSAGRKQGQGDTHVPGQTNRPPGAGTSGSKSGGAGAGRRGKDRGRSEVRRKIHDHDSRTEVGREEGRGKTKAVITLALQNAG